MAAVKKVIKKRRELKKIDKGQVHIKSSFNNTIITVTDTNGNTISHCSAGALRHRAHHHRPGHPRAGKAVGRRNCRRQRGAEEDRGPDH